MTPVERLLDRLEKVRASGKAKWQASCPAHDDRDPSLSVEEEADGTVLIYCHVGCSSEAVMQAVGLTLADLFPEREPGSRNLADHRRAHPRPKKEKTMDPLPTEEVLAGWRCDLLDNKQLMQRLLELRGWTAPTLNIRGVGYDGERIVFAIRNGEGDLVNIARYRPGERDSARKTLVLTGRPRDLFPRPEGFGGNPIWIVEGEADAISMAELGFLATGIPGVGGKRKATPERFTGRKVLICLDADDEGRGAARELADALVRHAADVRIVDIAPERDDGFDVTDLLVEASRNGGVKDAHAALLKMAADAAPIEQNADVMVSSAGARRLVARAATGIAPEPVRFLWEGRWPLGALALLAGEGGLGKSTLLVEQHARLSRGQLEGELFGEPHPSLIITSEDHAASVVVPRLIAAGADLSLVQIVTVEINGFGGLVTFPDDIEKLDALVDQTGARLLSVDPVVGALSGEIDSHKDHSIRRVLAPLAQLAERRDISITGVIHMNKSAVSDLLNRVSGSKGFVNAARSVVVFAHDPDDPDGDEGYERVIVHAKSNWGRLAPSLSATIESRRLHPEETGAEETITTSRLVITGESKVTRADISRRDDAEGADRKDLARHWLLKRLGSDTWHDSGEVKTEGEATGHKTRTLQRAFGELLAEGAAEHKSEGFPRRTYWLIHSRANPSGATGEPEAGATGEIGSTERKTAGSDSQSRQPSMFGATGATEAPEALDEFDPLPAWMDSPTTPPEGSS